MSERYWITGVQLGILKALTTFDERDKLINKIVDKQFIGDKKDLKDLQELQEIYDIALKENNRLRKKLRYKYGVKK